MTMVNAYAPGAAPLSEQEQALLERRERLLGPAYRLFYEKPVHLVRGAGVWLFDADGRRYLDAYNNVASVGHCHPRVVAAIAGQAAILNTHTRYLHEGVLDYAERLLALMPDALGHAMFTCTGSEANDLALRIAAERTGASGVIVTANAYHGVTRATAEVSPSLGAGVALGAHVRTVPPPGDGGEAFAAGVIGAIEDLARSGLRPAALIVDTIFSSDGVFAEPRGFLAPAVDAVRAAGGLFVADEVQPGFGRLGSAMWGFARHGVTPDIVTMGKPMGDGHPVAGLAVRPEHVAAFGAKARYFNTFGGNPVSCAAGMAVLDVIRDERLMDGAARTGAILRAAFEEMAARRGCIAGVRGEGLFFGVQMRSARDASSVVNGLRRRGVLVSASGPAGDVLKIRPPLVFGPEHADALLGPLDAELAALDT